MALEPLDATPPDVLALPLDVARERLSAAGLSVESVAETTAWRPEPPAGAEWRVVRQRMAAPDTVRLVVAPFRPPAGSRSDAGAEASRQAEPPVPHPPRETEPQGGARA